MKNLGKVLSFGALLAAGSFGSAVAQEDNSRGYNPNSVRPIHESDIMFKRTVWRRMDLNEKQNKPFFATNSEITRVIINAVKAGLLQPYTKDSLTEKMTLEKFNENLRSPDTAPQLDSTEAAIASSESSWDTPKGGAPAANAAVSASAYEFLPQEIKTLEIKEDLIFDKQRSRQYWDIQSITMVIPGEKFESGLDKVVAAFKFKDLVKIFRNDPKAIYFNTQNNREHKNLADAFDLRLHHARIVKISNPDDAYLSDVYEGGRQGLLASEQLEQQLMEFEHNLWEF